MGRLYEAREADRSDKRNLLFSGVANQERSCSEHFLTVFSLQAGQASDAAVRPLGEEPLPFQRGEGEGRGVDDVDGILPIAKSSLSLSHWSHWALPGHGKTSKKGGECGTFGFLGCLDVDSHLGKRIDGMDYSGKIYVKRYRRNCAKAECPIDYETWASKTASRGTRRIEAFQKTIRGKRNSPIHVVVSPSQQDIDALRYDELRLRAQKQAQILGIFAGVMILHPFRETDRGTWYLSPHFHIVGFGWISKVGESYRETGYVVKNLGVRKSVYATLMYQLSHAGVYMRAEGEKGKKATITWFGTLSYNKFHYKDEPIEHVCPICEQKLHVVEWRGIGDPPQIDDEAFFDDVSKWELKNDPLRFEIGGGSSFYRVV